MASCAERNLLDRCWFIFALGATPSMAMKSSFLGLTMAKILSMYSNMHSKTSLSRVGAGLPSG